MRIGIACVKEMGKQWNIFYFIVKLFMLCGGRCPFIWYSLSHARIYWELIVQLEELVGEAWLGCVELGAKLFNVGSLEGKELLFD